jgi:4-aminobutyrate--pyruvate transaminase
MRVRAWDRSNLRPDAFAGLGVAAYLVRRAQHHGAILRNMAGDIVAFSPPLIITEAEIDELLGCFGKALNDTWAMVREKGLV